MPVCIPLSDAVTLYAISTKRFKTARLSIYTMAPADEKDSPLATLLFGVLRRGSVKYPRLALLNRRLDDLYGTTLTLRNFLAGDDHVLSFTAEMLEDQYALPGEHPHVLDGTMELMAQLLLHPVIDEEGCLTPIRVEAEKKALADSIRSEINDPRSYAVSRLRQLMCAHEAYGLSLTGRTEELVRVTSETVTALYQRRLEKAHWEIYYVGAAAPDEVAACYRKYFGAFCPQRLRLSPTCAHMPPPTPRRIEEDLPIGQGKLCMAWASGVTDASTPVGGRDDYAAAVVLCELLGGMQSSLLFRHVREDLGLCYYCDAAFEGKKGILSVTSGIHPRHRRAAEEAILSVLSRIKAGDLSSEDVALAKLSLESSYCQMSDSPAAMEAYWFWSDRKTMPLPEKHLARFLSVTTEDVVRVSQKFLLDTVYFLNATKACEEVEDDDCFNSF